MNIVFVHSNNVRDQYQVQWRCKNIAKAIERTGLHHAALLDFDSFILQKGDGQKLCSEADLIIIHRYNVGLILQAALFWKSQKKKVVLDLDEAVDLIPNEMDHHRFWDSGELPPYSLGVTEANRKLTPSPLQQLGWSMTFVDAVTVSSKRLAGDWEAHGRIWEIPDYIDFDQYLISRNRQKEEIRIGMGGQPVSLQAYEQSGLLEALQEICLRYPKVKLFLGCVPSELLEKINIPPQQRAAFAWIPPEDWISYLTNLDIGLAPAMSEYDLRSSRSRVIEYLATKTPWIASDHLPYREFKDYGILVENTREAWYQNLVNVIESLESYQRMADGKPYLFAVSQDIDENIGKILDVYESILEA